MKHKEGTSPSNPRLLTRGHLMSIQKEGWENGEGMDFIDLNLTYNML